MRIRAYQVAITLALVVVGCAGNHSSSKTLQLKTEPLNAELAQESMKLDVPQPTTWELKNGLRVIYLYDDELPLMKGSLNVLGGGLFEPKGFYGVASLTGSQLREGAPQGFQPQQFDALLDKLGAAIESQYGEEMGSVSFTSLSDDFSEVFELFAKVALKPGFNPERLKIAKKLALDGILRRREDPELIAGATLKVALYGENNPYSSIPTAESIKRIEQQQLREFHARFMRPQGARLALTGSLPLAVVKPIVERYFGGWSAPEGGVTIASFPEAKEAIGPRVYVVERDFEQATIAMGHFGPARLSPDQFALSIFNRWFGMSGFESIIFSEIRSKLGLAYSVYGGFFSGARTGTFEIGLGTRASEAVNATQQVLRLIGETQSGAPDGAAIRNAKQGVNRSFVFRFSKPESIVQRRAYLEMLGFPLDFDSKYMGNIQSVSVEDIARVSRERVDLKRLKIVIVGKISSQEVADALQQEVQQVKFTEAPVFGALYQPRPKS